MSQFAEAEDRKKKEKESSRPTAPAQTAQRELEDVNGPAGGPLPGSVSAKIQSKRGSGRPLSGRQLEHYSEKFGRDMSDVRVHTDAESDTISRSLNARAFTIGSDVFLTKGINPDGVGRDQQTMTHELTHVVQQGGHAGFGSLRLGAADTSQEHEAEATAQREFEPEEEAKTKDTVQRGFFSDIGASIGKGLMEGIGLGEAFNDFMSGDDKVKTALDKMENGDREKFDMAEEDVKTLEPQLKEAEMTEDPAYTQMYDEYEDGLETMLELLQKADQSVTEADLNRYRSGSARALFSSVLSTLGASFRAGFARGDQKDEVRKKTAAQLNDKFSGGSRSDDKREEGHKGLRDVIKGVWRDVQDNDDLREKYKDKGWINFRSEMSREYSSLISESLEAGKPVEKVQKGVTEILDHQVREEKKAKAEEKKAKKKKKKKKG